MMKTKVTPPIAQRPRIDVENGVASASSEQSPKSVAQFQSGAEPIISVENQYAPSGGVNLRAGGLPDNKAVDEVMRQKFFGILEHCTEVMSQEISGLHAYHKAYEMSASGCRDIWVGKPQPTRDGGMLHVFAKNVSFVQKLFGSKDAGLRLRSYAAAGPEAQGERYEIEAYLGADEVFLSMGSKSPQSIDSEVVNRVMRFFDFAKQIIEQSKSQRV